MNSETHVVKDLLQRLALFTAESKIIEVGSVEEEVQIEADVQARGQAPEKEELQAPVHKKAPAFEAQDPLVEVNLGSADKPEMAKVSAYMRWMYPFNSADFWLLIALLNRAQLKVGEIIALKKRY